MSPRFETRTKPSGGEDLYRCCDCPVGRAYTRTQVVRWNGRFLCTEHATARGLAP